MLHETIFNATLLRQKSMSFNIAHWVTYNVTSSCGNLVAQISTVGLQIFSCDITFARSSIFREEKENVGLFRNHRLGLSRNALKQDLLAEQRCVTIPNKGCESD